MKDLSLKSLNLIPRRKNRNFYINRLKKNNIPHQIYYKKLINDHKPYKDSLYLDLQKAKQISKKIFAIPFHSYMNYKQLKQIKEALIN